MTVESRVQAARRAIAALRAALYTVEQVVDELEAEVATLRAVQQRPRGRLTLTCRNPACGKTFTRRVGDIRAGNTSGKFCCWDCAKAAKAVGRPRQDGGC